MNEREPHAQLAPSAATASSESSFDALVAAEIGDATPTSSATGSTVRRSSARTTAVVIDDDTIEGRDDGRAWLGCPPRDIFGLALSGGGIRSATFNLGLLQALDELGLLRVFDYLSTVSGGGYIGSFWSAWRKRQSGAQPGEFPRPRDDTPGSEPPAIRHLREFSNFLSPRLSALSYDTGRIFVALVSGTIPALLAALSLILLVVATWLIFARVMFAWQLQGSTVTAAWETPWASLLQRHGLTIGVWTFAVLTLAGFVVWEVVWRRREHAEGLGWYLLASVVGLAASAGFWWWWITSDARPLSPYATVGDLLPFSRQKLSLGSYVALLAPAAAWMFGVLVMVFLRWITSLAVTSYVWRARRNAFDRVTSRLLFAATSWTTIALLWIGGAWLWLYVSSLGASEAGALSGLAATGTALAGVFAKVQQILSRRPNKQSGVNIASRLAPVLPQLLAYATLATMVLGVMMLCCGLGASGKLWAGVTAALIVTALMLLFFNPNEVGLHAFYRARLARAYLGASNAAGGRRAEEQPRDDFHMDEMADGAPTHLVCCTANDLASKDPVANLNRGAVSAVLSRVGFSVGDEWASWRSGAQVPTLASAITASGAAFNSHMGSKSVELGPAVTFLMTAFNLRLGLWWTHPKRMRDGAGLERFFHGLAFYHELLGLSSAQGRRVLLSDGGHFENMALYELIRRHCRFIVSSDCGADPDVAFDDFGNLVRRVREDFGVEIVIDLSPLRPGEDGTARQAMVAGDIHYPEGDTGVLLLFKPTLVGTEPADIRQYKRRNADFPHETTGDQFYDEAQWESYRRLGAYAASNAFRAIRRELRDEQHAAESLPAEERADAIRAWGARVFARARRQWLPMPEEYVQRLNELVARASELDALLHESDCGTVLVQVYKEIDELDRMARVDGATSSHSLPSVVTPASSNGSPMVLDQKTLATSLHAIRRALLFMEDVYLSEDLEANYNHPMYLGLTNYFARWAYAPLFRMWWPLLKTLYVQRFTSFLETQFRLVGIDSALYDASTGRKERIIVDLTEGAEGFAAQCWRLQDGRMPSSEQESFLSYRLRMHYRPSPGAEQRAYLVQGGQLLVWKRDDLVVWNAREFYVPPGLWGVGIGEDFLQRLADGEGIDPSVTHLLVRIPNRRTGTAANRKEGADLTQLYRSAGFLEVTPPAGKRSLLVHMGEHAAPIDLSQFVFGERDGDESRWLVRCIRGRCAATAPHGYGGAVGATYIPGDARRLQVDTQR